MVRARRVKCDEATPSCLRCISAGRHCEGYTTPSPPQTASVSKHGNRPYRQLLPATAAQEQPLLSVALRYSWGSAATNDTERNAFTYFLQETAAPLEVILGPQRFVRRALQISNELPAVFNAITAVGSMACTRAQIHIADCTLTQLKTGVDETTALNQYCKATSSLRRYIDNAVAGKADVEPVLICSLLFVLFEIFRGEVSLAVSHLRHGHRALQELLTLNTPERSSTTSAAMDELVSMFDMLGMESLSSSLPVEKQGSCGLYQWPVPMDFSSQAFESVAHAKHMLENITAETCSWREELLVIANGHLDAVTLDDSSSVAARFSAAQCLSRSIVLSPDLIRRRADLIVKHEKWSHMLAPLQLSGLAEAQSLSMLMQLQHFYSYFLLRTARDTTEIGLDSCEHEFRRVLDLAERYLNEQSRCHTGPARPDSYERLLSFSLEAGPLPVLFLTCLKCRDQGLRNRALRLLQSANRREGLQYSGELSVYAGCMVRFEEEQARKLSADQSQDPGRSLDWWFERIPEAARYPSLVIQGVGYHEIRVIGCRYLNERCTELELIELRGTGMPPLTLEELQRSVINLPARISAIAAV